ncbi:PLD nuclease N-terminal domain-containing protein [Vagococcus allomyrinae]|uniref:PLD nuclease N-terminal domain-containing protein n=1 Tax=Vagococcus allomyrinae TaxID=2794353 RepID=UPI001FD758CF|nr:PLD nuclease N-terminal domain-containing protein [Vagococcus allomyrinae]
MNIGINMPSIIELRQLLPLLVPLLLIQLSLAIVAVVKIVKQTEFRYLNKASWLVIVLLLQFIGPACYFVFGRGEE